MPKTHTFTRQLISFTANKWRVALLISAFLFGCAANAQDPLHVEIISAPNATVRWSAVTFIFEITGDYSEIYCSLDGETPTPCESPIGYTNLPNGTHRFLVTAIGTAGTRGANASHSFQVDAPTQGNICQSGPLRRSEISRGCSALQLAAEPERIVQPYIAAIERAEKLVGDHNDRKRVLRALDTSERFARKAGKQLRDAEVCEAAESSRKSAMELNVAKNIERQAVVGQLDKLQKAGLSITGDVAPEEMQAAMLEFEEELLIETLQAATDTLNIFQDICNATVGPTEIRGVVSNVNDAAKNITINNIDIGLPVRTGKVSINPGDVVAISGIEFNDGSALASAVIGDELAGKPEGVSCMKLQIAPVQNFNPPIRAYALHDTDGYELEGVLQLERHMRLAAADLGCPKTTPNGENVVYYMWIIHYPSIAPGGITLSHNLREGDEPLKLTAAMEGDKEIPLTTKVFVKNCPVGQPEQACGPKKLLREEDYTIIIRPTGSYVDAVYDKYDLKMEIYDEVEDFDSASVTGFIFRQGAVSDTPVSFRAEGYSIIGDDTSKPIVNTIGRYEPFAIYAETDFMDPSLSDSQNINQNGQIEPSGLRWPRAEGTRNNSDFWYYTKLPPITYRDVIATSDEPDCEAKPGEIIPQGELKSNPQPGTPIYWSPEETFTTEPVYESAYKLPFAAGRLPDVGQGNADDPWPSAGHYLFQRYAWDFNAPSLTPLFAARGGQVVKVVENDPYNNDDRPEGHTGKGNYVFIRHSDDTLGIYWHMPENGVWVEEGEYVARGDFIGVVGNTGNSTEPHVHFEVTNATDSNARDGSKRVMIEAAYDNDVTDSNPPVLNKCSIPKFEDNLENRGLYSTNETPTL